MSNPARRVGRGGVARLPDLHAINPHVVPRQVVHPRVTHAAI
jgi:hypothetical protein